MRLRGLVKKIMLWLSAIYSSSLLGFGAEFIFGARRGVQVGKSSRRGGSADHCGRGLSPCSSMPT